MEEEERNPFTEKRQDPDLLDANLFDGVGHLQVKLVMVWPWNESSEKTRLLCQSAKAGGVMFIVELLGELGRVSHLSTKDIVPTGFIRIGLRGATFAPELFDESTVGDSRRANDPTPKYRLVYRNRVSLRMAKPKNHPIEILLPDDFMPKQESMPLSPEQPNLHPVSPPYSQLPIPPASLDFSSLHLPPKSPLAVSTEFASSFIDSADDTAHISSLLLVSPLHSPVIEAQKKKNPTYPAGPVVPQNDFESAPVLHADINDQIEEQEIAMELNSPPSPPVTLDEADAAVPIKYASVEELPPADGLTDVSISGPATSIPPGTSDVNGEAPAIRDTSPRASTQTFSIVLSAGVTHSDSPKTAVPVPRNLIQAIRDSDLRVTSKEFNGTSSSAHELELNPLNGPAEQEVGGKKRSNSKRRRYPHKAIERAGHVASEAITAPQAAPVSIPPSSTSPSLPSVPTVDFPGSSPTAARSSPPDNLVAIPPTYSRILDRNSANLGGEVNLIGVVSFVGEAKESKTGDWLLPIGITDPSRPQGITITFFSFVDQKHWVPQVRIGDVLLVRHIKLPKSNGALTGYKHRFLWASLDRSSCKARWGDFSGDEPPNEQCSRPACEGCIRVRKTPFWRPTAQELAYMKSLADWHSVSCSPQDQSSVQYISVYPKTDKFKLMSEVTLKLTEESKYKGKVFIDCVVEIVRVFEVSDTAVNIWVTDYTENPRFKYGDNFSPPGNFVAVFVLWGKLTALAETMKAGDIYRFRNASMEDRGAGLEGHIHEDGDSLDGVNKMPRKSTDPRVQELLNRKNRQKTTGSSDSLSSDLHSNVPVTAVASVAYSADTSSQPSDWSQRRIPNAKISVKERSTLHVSTISQIKKQTKVPQTFKVKARIADHEPLNYREFVHQCCSLCGRSLGTEKCQHCTELSEPPPPPVLRYRFIVCLEDVHGDTLPVALMDEHAEMFLNQPPTLDHTILVPTLRYRMEPLTGNLHEFRAALENGQQTTRMNGSILEYCIASLQLWENGKLETRYKIVNSVLEVEDPDLDGAY